MSEAAAALGHDGSAAGPCFASAELPAQLLEACAAAAAVGEAIELGVLARVAEGAADPMTVAADCGLTQQGAAALLAALAGLDLLVLSDDGRFRPAFAGLADFAELAGRGPPSDSRCAARGGRPTHRPFPERRRSIRVSWGSSRHCSARVPSTRPAS